MVIEKNLKSPDELPFGVMVRIGETGARAIIRGYGDNVGTFDDLYRAARRYILQHTGRQRVRVDDQRVPSPGTTEIQFGWGKPRR